MNIIVGEENARHLDGRYLILELDSFRISQQSDPIKSYALIDSVTFVDLSQADEHKKLHQDLIKNYRLKNWKSCEIIIDQLLGKWNGDLDSFYKNLSERITDLKTKNFDKDWDWSVIKT
jgi:hypothetical protein